MPPTRRGDKRNGQVLAWPMLVTIGEPFTIFIIGEGNRDVNQFCKERSAVRNRRSENRKQPSKFDETD
jgi:hypothetical protein